MNLPAEKLAQVGNDLGLLIPGLWWTPERIAFHNGQGWKTVPWQKFIPKGQKMQTLGVSPVGTDGMAHFVAWDMDGGNPGDVKAILSALPQGVTPLVSASGKKGWHVWVFPSEPLPVETAIRFAKLIRERAGVCCEIFPSSRRSRCLKWPLSIHPETGKPEVFVHEDDLTTEYDTEALLEALAGGMWRTPSEVIIQYVEAHCSTKPKPEKQARKARPAQRVEGHWVEVFKDDQAGFKLLQLFGKHTRASRLGQAFRCPIHNERRPSASFYKADNGVVVFHDFHASSHGLEEEFYLLPELYHALKSGGELRKLNERQLASCGKELAFLLGYRNSLVEKTLKQWSESTRILLKLGVVTNLIFIRLVTTPTPKDWLKALNLNGLSDFERVWVMCFWCSIQDAMDGKAVTVMSKRFLGDKAGVKYWAVNRALNLLCSLGFLQKGEVVKRGKKRAADRYQLAKPDEDKVQRRFNALFPSGKADLRKFKASLVAAKLGPEVAAKVFRRQTETVKETVSQTVSETVTQTVRSLLAEIQAQILEAQDSGDWEKVKHLQRLFMEEVRKSKGRPAETHWSSFGIPSQYLRNTLAMP